MDKEKRKRSGIKMRVASYTICHYGVAYLQYALQSSQSLVDNQFIIYTQHPSHGHQTHYPCPESREDLMSSIAHLEKTRWVDVDKFYHEGPQRDFSLSLAIQEGDLVLVQDYDEVWPYKTLVNVIDHVWKSNSARNWLINFTHFWRSFDWVCRDDGWPVRIIDSRHNSGLAYVPKELGEIYHFGYAVTNDIMHYKLSCHGHKDELRPNWFEEKWLAWPPPEDCHPTNGRKQDGSGWWDPQPFDKHSLPDLMLSHPYFGLERIE